MKLCGSARTERRRPVGGAAAAGPRWAGHTNRAVGRRPRDVRRVTWYKLISITRLEAPNSVHWSNKFSLQTHACYGTGNRTCDRNTSLGKALGHRGRTMSYQQYVNMGESREMGARASPSVSLFLSLTLSGGENGRKARAQQGDAHLLGQSKMAAERSVCLFVLVCSCIDSRCAWTLLSI